MSELPPELAEYASQLADITSHHIEGIAVMGDTPFSCPLISHVEGNLWQGGTPADSPRREVPPFFTFVFNLYPWQSYNVHPETTVYVHKLYDGREMPDIEQLEATARTVNEARAKAPTLVHCQAGLNRSALVVGLALIRSGMTADAAIALLREKRSPAVLCNQTFERWLRTQG